MFSCYEQRKAEFVKLEKTVFGYKPHAVFELRFRLTLFDGNLNFYKDCTYFSLNVVSRDICS